MFQVTASGNVGRDPEEKDVNGNQVVEFSVAAVEDRNRKNIWWINVSAWGPLGKIAMDYVRKGDRVTVIGPLTKNEKDGKTYYNMTANAIDLQPKQSDNNDSGNDSGNSGGGWGQKSKPAPSQPAAKTWGQPTAQKPSGQQQGGGAWKGGAPAGGNGGGWGQSGGGSSGGGAGGAEDDNDPIPF